MVLPVLPSGFQGEGCEVCPVQGWRATRQRHLVCVGGVWSGPLGDLGCSGEGTRRSHTGEGSAFWAAGVRDSMPIFTYLVTFSIFHLGKLRLRGTKETVQGDKYGQGWRCQVLSSSFCYLLLKGI